MIKRYLFIFLLTFLVSCSNRFGEVSKEINDNLSSIEIKLQYDSINLYEFQTHLTNLLNNTASKDKKYRLEIEISEKQYQPVIQKDAESLRETTELTINFKLYNNLTSSLLYKSKFRKINSFNTLFSPYSSNLEMIQSSFNLYKTSAEELRRKLIIFFKNNHTISQN